jgi:hypothetical protein
VRYNRIVLRSLCVGALVSLSLLYFAPIELVLNIGLLQCESLLVSSRGG